MKRKQIVNKIYSGGIPPNYIESLNGMIDQRQIDNLITIAFSRVTDFIRFEKQTVLLPNGKEIESTIMILREPEQLTGEHLPAIARINQTGSGLEIILYDKLKALDMLAEILPSLLGDKLN